MDSASLNVLKKSVECVICQEPQINPKVLPCQHTFCKECLDETVRFNNDGNGTISCPMKCRGIIQIKADKTTNSLPNNYSLQSVLDIIKASYDRYAGKNI